MKQQHIHASATTTAPPEVVWDLVADVATWTTWAPFQAAELERPGPVDPGGVGAIRRFQKGRARTREEVTDVVPGEVLSYRLLDGLPLDDYTAAVRLERTGTGTTIHWSAEFRARIPGTGWLFRRGMQRLYEDFAGRLGVAAATAERREAVPA
jgi:uncharacterized protein YndB with AHSA1/START domain